METIAAVMVGVEVAA